MSAQDYFGQVSRLLEHLRTTQQDAIQQAADWIAASIEGGAMLHVFGASHSSLIAAEMFYRAGGLVPVSPITDPNLDVLAVVPKKGTQCERLAGYGKIILDSYDVRPGEILLIASQSGKNTTTVEVALEAQRRGLKIIAITSLNHSRAARSSDASGKKLYEIADLVIDTGTPLGDASVTVAPDAPKVAPLSSVAGMIVVNAIVAQVAANFAARGKRPPTWVSSNVPEGDAANAAALRAYVPRSRYV